MPGHYFGRNKAVLGNVSNIVYQLLARFNTPVAAPLPNPLLVDTGQLNITDTGSKLSISNGSMACSGVTVANSDPFVVSTSTYARSVGLAFFWDFQLNTITTDGARAGLSANNGGNTTYTHHIDYYNNIALPILSNGTTPDGGGANVTGSMYRYGIILRNTGAFYLYQAPNSGNVWKVIYIENVGTTSNLYFKVVNRAITYLLDNIEVTSLTGVFSTDYGFATTRVTNIGANATGTHTNDCFIEFTFVAAATETQVRYRYTDDNNNWIISCVSGLTIYQDVAGTITNRGAVSSVFTTGTTYRVVIRAESNIHRVFVNDALKITYTDSSNFNLNATQYKVFLAPNQISELIAWPIYVSLPSGI